LEGNYRARFEDFRILGFEDLRIEFVDLILNS
jgi:hypothetical protein